MKPAVFLTLLAISYAQFPERRPVKRSYVCPPKFIRQGHRCYYFSKDQTTWQDAHFRCRDMHSNIAIIKNANQDKLIKNFLSQKSLSLQERWIGGVYDWEQMAWKWFSGKPLIYSGFEKSDKEDKEALRWHCIIMDPSLGYKWSSRSCVEQKHYICQTKLKEVSNKGKKKLQRQYHADKFNKLNEIPVPTIPDYTNNNSLPLKANLPFAYNLEINNSLNDQALFAETPVAKQRKARKNKKKRKSKSKYRQLHFKRDANCTVVEVPSNSLDTGKRKTYRCKENETDLPRIENLQWKNYQKKVNRTDSLYPHVIVEEYYFAKEH